MARTSSMEVVVAMREVRVPRGTANCRLLLVPTQGRDWPALASRHASIGPVATSSKSAHRLLLLRRLGLQACTIHSITMQGACAELHTTPCRQHLDTMWTSCSCTLI